MVGYRRYKERIEELKKEDVKDEGEVSLDEGRGKNELERLKKRFVLVTADKSEKNVIVVCRRYYVKKIREELLSENEEGRRTYEEEEKEEEEIIQEQIERLKRYGLEVEEKMKRLATLYWTAKMHYDPPRARFIAASGKCVLKVLSQLLSKCLKLVQEQRRSMCKGKVGREDETGEVLDSEEYR